VGVLPVASVSGLEYGIGVITLAHGSERVQAVRVSASAVVFNRRDEVLLQQRSDGGQWGLPGGTVEIGERVQEAVVREVREETGLVVRPLRLVGIYSDPKLQIVRYPDGNVWHYVTLCFECRAVRGRLTTCNETLALSYFDVSRLPRMLLTHHRIRIRDACARRATPFIR
jgi:8-oxo-dGTP pyrophosphatase MutT (NUDIX family)